MMCCSDPVSVAPVDDADRTIWLRASDLAGWHQSSPVGWAPVRAGGDCDGLTRSPFLDFSTCPPPLTNVRALTDDEMRLFGDTDFRTVEIRTGTGRPLGRLSSGPAFTFEQEIPMSGSFKAAEPLPTMWWYRRVGAAEWTLSKEYPNPTDPGSWEVVACTSARVEPIRFDNTPDPRTIPPEKIAAARKAIDAITARQKGLAGKEWPAGWHSVEIWPGCKVRPFRPDEPVMACPRLPDTERGRRAAWELEGA